MTRELPRWTRRSFVAACGVAGLAGCQTPAGRTQLTATDGRKIRTSGTWPMGGRNGGQRSFNPDAMGPSAPAGELWDGSKSLGRTDILASPVIANGRLYIGCGVTVYALDVGTGETYWTKRLAGRANKFTPALVDGTLFVVETDTKQRLWAFDVSDGSVQWTRTMSVVSSPVVREGRIYLVTRTDAGDQIRAIRPADGAELWVSQIGSRPGHYRTRTPPAVSGDSLYMATTVGTDSSDASGKLFALDANDGGTKWTLDVAGPVTRSGAAVSDGVVYFGDNAGVVHAVDAGDRSERWSFSTEGQFWTTPALDDERVYVGANDGTLSALEPESGAVHWQTQTELTYANPAVDSDTVYVGGKSLLGIDAATGDVDWRFNYERLFSSQFTSPVVVGDVLAAASCVKEKAGQTIYDDYVTVLS